MVPNRVEALTEAVPLCVLKHSVDVEKIKLLIVQEITKCSLMMNVANNINTPQINFTAETIMEQYPAESVEDIVICLRRGSQGYYGAIYHQFDTSVILGWMAKHIEEKAIYIERNHQQAKNTEKNIQVDYEAFKKRLEEKRKEEASSAERKREASILHFVDRAGNGRKAFDVPIEDENGNPVGTVENVYAPDYETAKKIVIRAIEQGKIRF